MCLGVPGRIEEIWEEGGARMARVEFVGEQRRICLAYLPDTAVGDHVIAHLGFAVTKVDAETAASTIALMREFGVLDDEPTPGSAA